eukprot:gene16685-18379_t
MEAPAKIRKLSNGAKSQNRDDGGDRPNGDREENSNFVCKSKEKVDQIKSINGIQEKLSKGDAVALREKLIGRATQIHFPEDPIKISYAKGQFMYDNNGHEYLDCMNNVAHVGHCHPHVVKAGQNQMAYLETNSRFLHDELLILAKRLTSLLPEELSVCFLVCTGTEANDLALRMARTYTEHEDVVVLDRAYHGHSVAITEISPYKFKRLSKVGQKKHVHVCPCPDAYRGMHRGENDEALGDKYANEMQKTIDSALEDGRNIAAFYAESLQSCGGQIIYPPGFLKKAFQYTRAAGGVCISDEVQVGFGRVGKAFWAFELHDVIPDIVTIGKPFGNGHPVSAVITTQKIADAFENTKVAYFNTFGGNPVSCAIGNAVLDVIENEKLQQNAKEVGEYWLNQLNAIKDNYEFIGDVRGVGLFIGIELVNNRETREPATEMAKQFTYGMRKNGVLISADGPFSNVLKIKPPMVVNKNDVDRFMKVFQNVCKQINAQ